MPFASKQWIDQALASAESEPVRLVCLRWLASRHAAAGQYAQAQSLLASIEGQFAAAESRQQVQEIKQSLGAAANRATAMKAALAKQMDLDRLKGQIAFLEARLAEAKRQNRPSSDLSSVQRLIDQAKQALSEASSR